MLTLIVALPVQAELKASLQSNVEGAAELFVTAESAAKLNGEICNVMKHSGDFKCDWKDEQVPGCLKQGKYCHPKNFTINISDITTEMEEKRLKRQERKDDIAAIKNMVSSIRDDASLKPYLKKLLIRLAKDIE